jgi:alkylation response protein AidB-like acyl-CoA dehydrogenase
LQGAANATSTALDDVVLAALGVEASEKTAVVLPAAGGWAPPGDGGGVRGLATPRAARADTLVIVAATGPSYAAHVVPRESVTLEPVAGIDPALGLVAVRGDLPTGTGTPVQWADAVAAGQLALAYELLGVTDAMVQLGRNHAVDRVQFGRAIASFQAVRHRLADALVAYEAADAAVAAAWTDPSPVAAALAKAIAGRAARTAARHAQQVLGGMGFTTEHVLHRHVRRSFALDQIFGSSQRLTTEIGEQILRDRRLPAMLPL